MTVKAIVTPGTSPSLAQWLSKPTDSVPEIVRNIVQQAKPQSGVDWKTWSSVPATMLDAKFMSDGLGANVDTYL